MGLGEHPLLGRDGCGITLDGLVDQMTLLAKHLLAVPTEPPAPLASLVVREPVELPRRERDGLSRLCVRIQVPHCTGARPYGSTVV